MRVVAPDIVVRDLLGGVLPGDPVDHLRADEHGDGEAVLGLLQQMPRLLV